MGNFSQLSTLRFGLDATKAETRESGGGRPAWPPNSGLEQIAEHARRPAAKPVLKHDKYQTLGVEGAPDGPQLAARRPGGALDLHAVFVGAQALARAGLGPARAVISTGASSLDIMNSS